MTIYWDLAFNNERWLIRQNYKTLDWLGKIDYFLTNADKARIVIIHLARVFTQKFVRTFFMKYWVKIKSLFTNSGYLSEKIRKIRKCR